MNKQRITISECIEIYQIDDEFLEYLVEYELINLDEELDKKYINIEDLSLLQRYAQWHYDLNINLPGIEMLSRMKTILDKMEIENKQLKNMLQFFKSNSPSSFEDHL